jgi:hypothetical protein
MVKSSVYAACSAVNRKPMSRFDLFFIATGDFMVAHATSAAQLAIDRPPFPCDDWHNSLRGSRIANWEKCGSFRGAACASLSVSNFRLPVKRQIHCYALQL